MRRMNADTGNWGVIGHERAVGSLRRALIHGRSRHAYLLSGSANLGKRTLALRFAMALNCEAGHAADRPCGQCPSCQRIASGADPDVILAGADESGRLRIGVIREVMRVLALKPYASRYRVAILDDFDAVMPNAQDALLKTLEEPPPHAVLILLSRSAEHVLPTIRSRAQIIPLRPLPSRTIESELRRRGADDVQADLLAGLSGGRIGWALAALDDPSLLQSRDAALDTLERIVAGDRVARLKTAESLTRKAGKDKSGIRAMLEIWATYWRDALLACCGSPLRPCNGDRADAINALSLRIDTSQALNALHATRRSLNALQTNANVRLALDVLLLDYPGLD